MLNKKRIVIFVVFLCCLFFMTTFAGSPAQNTVIATRSVVFVDGFNNENISEQTIEVGTDASVPSDPVHDGYVFVGWFLYENQEVKVEEFTNILSDLKVIAKYAGDANRNGIADDNDASYTVTFMDSISNTVIARQEVLSGMAATTPTIPVHAGYEFIGWDGSYVNVSGDVTVTTVYREVTDSTEAITYYNVTFMDTVSNTVLEVVRVQEGLTPDAPDAALYDKKIFVGWDVDFSNVTSDLTVNTVYVDDENENGIDDVTEDTYLLTVNYVVVNSKDEVVIENFQPSYTIDLLGGVDYSAETPEVTGYEVVLSDDYSGKMPYEAKTITVKYTVANASDDSNDNGLLDKDEPKYTVVINYVSLDENGNVVEVIATDTPSDEYVVDNSYDVTTLVNEKTESLKANYTLANADEATGTIVADNANDGNEIVVTIKYNINKGKDLDGNGILDENEDKYTLTVNYVVVDKDGKVLINDFKPAYTIDLVENAKYTVVAKGVDGYTIVNADELNIVMPKEAKTVTVKYAVANANDDSNNNGLLDKDEPKYTVVINYVSLDENGKEVLFDTDRPSDEYVVDNSYDVTELVNEKTESLKANYTLANADEATGTIVADNANDDNEIVVTIKYTINEGKDLDGNGILDENEDKYTLTVNYVVVDKDGKVLINDFKPAYTINLVENAKYTVVAEGVDGYTIVNDDELNIVMTKPSKTVTVKYAVANANDDSNNNGLLDKDEPKYTVVINYVSLDENGKVAEVIATDTPSDEYVVDNSYDVTTLVNIKTESLKANYTLANADEATGAIIADNANDDNEIVVTIKYTINEGKDLDGNGILDENEDKYTLTVNYVVVDKDGKVLINDFKPSYTINLVENAKYLVVAEGVYGYTIVNADELNIVMTKPSKTVTVKYAVTNPADDSNNNGLLDKDEPKYTVVVNYVVVDRDGKEVSLGTERSTTEYVVDNSYDVNTLVNAKTTSLGNYYNFVSGATKGTIVANNANDKNEIVVKVVYSYNYPVIKDTDITTNPTGWTNQKEVTLTVNSKDANGVAISEYSFDGGKSFSSVNTYKAKENETVKIVVMDVNGKTSEVKEFKPMIDTIKPVINLPAKKDAEGAPTYTVEFTVTDLGGSGVDRVTYATVTSGNSEDQAIDVKLVDGVYQFTVAGSKKYEVFAYDKAGNKADSAIIEITNISTDGYTDNGPTNESVPGATIGVGANETEKGWFGANINPKRHMTVTANDGVEIISVKWAADHLSKDEMINGTEPDVHTVDIVNNTAEFDISGHRRTFVYTVYVETSEGSEIKYYYCNANIMIFGIFDYPLY